MYVLQALIAPPVVFTDVLFNACPSIELPQGLALLPLSHALLERFGLPALPMTDGACLPDAFVQQLAAAARHAPLVYVETEHFAGGGSQACLLFSDGGLRDSRVAPDALNAALGFLGICAGEQDIDGFAALGLRRHRHTEEWFP